MCDASAVPLPKFLEKSGRKLYRVLPDGNCLFRSISHQLCGTEENHSSVRVLIQCLVNLNKSKFSPFLMEVNEKTIEEHIKKIGMPYTWGTHIEVLAAATLYGISIYITRQSSSGSYFWEEIKPLKADGFSRPVVPSDLLRKWVWNTVKVLITVPKKNSQLDLALVNGVEKIASNVGWHYFLYDFDI